MGGLLHCSLILWYLLLAVWCLPMTVKSVYAAARGYVCSSVPNPYCTLFWQSMWSQLAGKCCQFWAPFIWTLRSTRTPKNLILADGRYTHAWNVLFDRFDRSQYSVATDAMSSLFICIAGAGPDVVRQEVEAAFFLHHLVLQYSWRLDGEDVPMAHPYVEFSKGLPIEIWCHQQSDTAPWFVGQL